MPMTIGQLIDTLQHEVELGWVTRDDIAYVATPTGLEELAGVDPKYDAIPNEPRLALVVLTEEN